MKAKRRNTAHYVLLILLTAAILLICNAVVLLSMMARWSNTLPVSKNEIYRDLTVQDGEYALSAEGRNALESSGAFAVLLDNSGRILWSECLPQELNRSYTMQDVASFTRYYLDDYPVRTYIVEEGLLIIGGVKDSVWKYTLEYNSSLLRSVLFRQLPLWLACNTLVLVLVPLFIQRRWLRRKETERTEWIAGVSHDIRTPLTLIVGHADSLRQTAIDPDSAQKAEAISAQALKIRSLVANLNTSSKLSYGMGRYEKKDLPLPSCLREVTADILNQNPGMQYDFCCEVAEPAVNASVKANEELLKRMVENLIGNSIRHNPQGCRIRIALAPASRVGRWELSISDDGVGTEAETFRMLNRCRGGKQKLGEHGVGLLVVKQIADFHGWKVHFSPNVPSGFITKITL